MSIVTSSSCKESANNLCSCQCRTTHPTLIWMMHTWRPSSEVSNPPTSQLSYPHSQPPCAPSQSLLGCTITPHNTHQSAHICVSTFKSTHTSAVPSPTFTLPTFAPHTKLLNISSFAWGGNWTASADLYRPGWEVGADWRGMLMFVCEIWIHG